MVGLRTKGITQWLLTHKSFGGSEPLEIEVHSVAEGSRSVAELSTVAEILEATVIVFQNPVYVVK